jgi:hypothetical protein
LGLSTEWAFDFFYSTRVAFIIVDYNEYPRTWAKIASTIPGKHVIHVVVTHLLKKA